MAKFKMGNKIFNFTTFYEFVKFFDLYNNEILNEKNFNKGINQLKRELNTVFGLLKIITNTESIRWRPDIIYSEGEVVSYLNKDNPSHEEIQDSFYIALYNTEENLAMQPDIYNDFWMKISIDDIFPLLNSKNWARFHNDHDWTQDQPFDLVNVRNLLEKLKELEAKIKELLSDEYIKQDNSIDLVIEKPTHVTTKKYVDEKTKQIQNTLQDLSGLLDDYVKLDKDRKLTTKNNTSAAILTTDTGFLPGINNISAIGSPTKIFKAMYATDFHGTALRAKYADLSEIYECSESFEYGTVLGIDESGIKEYNSEIKYLGVVTKNPGFVLNSSENGVNIALKGQTPVKVKGKVKKGQYIIAWDSGYAMAFDSLSFEESLNLVGIALENSDDLEIKYINVKI